jgi:hypothetical protein
MSGRGAATPAPSREIHLSQREATAASLKSEIEKRFDPVGVRARLLARRNAGHANP